MGEARLYTSFTMLYKNLCGPSYSTERTVVLRSGFTDRRYTTSQLSFHIALIFQNVKTYRLFFIVAASLTSVCTVCHYWEERITYDNSR